MRCSGGVRERFRLTYQKRPQLIQLASFLILPLLILQLAPVIFELLFQDLRGKKVDLEIISGVRGVLSSPSSQDSALGGSHW